MSNTPTRSSILKSMYPLIHNKQLVCISETTHFSIDSHKFHLDLLKLCYQDGINTITTELLTPLDAYFMTLWVKGELKCSLLGLFSDILFMTGIGTYPILKWAKRQQDITFIGLEKRGSRHFILKEGSKPFIKDLVKPAFYKLLIDLCNTDNPYPLTELFNKHDFEPNILEKTIIDEVLVWLEQLPRLKLWSKRLSRVISQTRILAIGYHFTYDESLKSRAFKDNCVSFAMGCGNKKVFTIRLKDDTLTDSYFKLDRCLTRGTLDFECQGTMLLIQDILSNTPLKVWASLTIRMGDLVPLTSCEKATQGYALVPQDGTKKLTICGYMPLPNHPDIKSIKYKPVVPSVDYIIMIPKSRVDNRLYM